MGLLGKLARTPAPPLDANGSGTSEKAVLQLEHGKQAAAPPPIDAAVEKRLLRKLDTRLTPLVAGLFLLSFLDRSNIGFVWSPLRRTKSTADLHCLSSPATPK